ncbi:UNKNOWN [Stylonychia lemnae]|uniref:Dynein light chain tctex-type 1 n=1 Tax=Stylonychia lemnae TaxID=5949 RepID=A0A078A4K7_STYLE|nr:UNKNOWN [Stylonychia lemnae]|eukprot:CDW77188.1 UNKNOWN [Stylonychia lemnae]
MENMDDDMDFNSEQVQKVAQQAVELVVGSDNIVYQKDKVNQWCQQIIETCIKDLAKLQKPFKYAVTCIITQNNGSGLQTAATAYWETKKDGLISVQLGSATFYCIVTIFAMSI